MIIQSAVDKFGSVISEGDFVVFLEATDALLSGLPQEDQAIIKSMVGESLEVQGFDDHGNVELGFMVADGEFHFIWVSGLSLQKDQKA